ncbi:MAG: xanthan lyase [Porphyromonas sp.]|nr:xanthan lyase [Porphyromonas sp.]
MKHTILKIITFVLLTLGLYGARAEAQSLVRPQAPLHTATKGLSDKHIAMWQSHGYYFEPKLNRWEWQRARIFQTVEDLYTQSYVLPFLVPMLENSDAVVLLPRERDTSVLEYIIDNDLSDYAVGQYSEESGVWLSEESGFAYLRPELKGFENPFREGTSRRVKAEKSPTARAFWRFQPAEEREHAVYVAYQNNPDQVTDAHYTVHHEGGETTILVNQSIGGGTWVYLGHFPFSPDEEMQGVELTNESHEQGQWVSADGVKIGGGMGNVARAYQDTLDVSSSLGVALQEYQTSGYPRYCEAARYWLQWAGIPDTVYTKTEGLNDYTDDYRCRGYWVNYLAGSTPLNPEEEGLRIPLDLSFAFHTDAGTLLGDSIVGTLGIYYTGWNDGFYPDGRSRTIAQAYTDSVMTSIVHDVRALHAPEWVRREMWDKAYSEATHPVVPTMLLELLSHQNFPDMRYGLDPEFRFTVSRAVYKGMLRFLAAQEGRDYVVQPLPVREMSVHFASPTTATLKWQPTEDPLEPTALPTGYILYTSVDGKAFDQGQVVTDTSKTLLLRPGEIYRYKVVAFNEGGRSFPSEVLAIGTPETPKGSVMVVNGFTRVSAPDWFDFPKNNIAGFLPEVDGGVPYLYDISYIGAQKEFDRTIPWIDDDYSGFGDSRSDYETEVIAGNTFDYPYRHGRAILASGYAFASTSASYIQQHPDLLLEYDAVDLILGKQKQTYKGPRDGRPYHYKSMPRALRNAIEQMANANKGILISGSYVGSDLWNDPDSAEQASGRAFAQEVLNYFLRADKAATQGGVHTVQNQIGLSRQEVHYTHQLSPTMYRVESPDAIEPMSGAVTIMRYSENNLSAAVAYEAGFRSVVLGFPLESIEDEGELSHLIGELLPFLIRE